LAQAIPLDLFLQFSPLTGIKVSARCFADRDTDAARSARNKTIIRSPEGDSWFGKLKKRPGAIDVLQQILP
jgi:hypothetical protein